MDATFDESMYADTEGIYEYNEIISEKKRVSLNVKHTDWVREAFPDPNDSIAITFEHFCPSCQ